MVTADIITNIKEGSQLSLRVKNPRIFEILHIPESVSPNPKNAPKIYESINSFLKIFYFMITNNK